MATVGGGGAGERRGDGEGRRRGQQRTGRGSVLWEGSVEWAKELGSPHRPGDGGRSSRACTSGCHYGSRSCSGRRGWHNLRCPRRASGGHYRPCDQAVWQQCVFGGQEGVFPIVTELEGRQRLQIRVAIPRGVVTLSRITRQRNIL